MKLGKIGGLRLLTWAAVVLVAVSVIFGLYLAGSPSKERDRKFDQQRTESLRQMSDAIDQYYVRNGKLPADIEALAKMTGGPDYYIGSVRDPRTSAFYEYQPSAGPAYSLCATFEQPSDPTDQTGAPYSVPVKMPYGPRDFTHGIGRVCFNLNAEDATSGPGCGLQNPCQAGQTCALLPRHKSAVCVPAGRECLAAGCQQSQCVMAESYPVQVSCGAASDSVAPGLPQPASDCRLMRDPQSGKVGCFGCTPKSCSNPPAGWENYDAPQKDGYMGIPYSCYADPNAGCQLAQ
jgi:hypothetical protein